MNKMFCLIGASASGKSTVEEKLLQDGFERLVSDTTRAIRDNEIDGIHYNFLTVEEFLTKEYANVIKISDTWFYGVSEDELNRLSKVNSIYSCINIEPVMNVLNFIDKKSIPIEVFLVFFDIDRNFRIDLLRKRGDSEESIKKRFEREESVGVFDSFGKKPDLIVKDFYNAYDIVKGFIDGRI